MDSSVLLTYQEGAATPTRYALKADSVTISISKTPIQIPIPQNSPELIDFGIFRPAITVTALVDNIGGDTSQTASNYQGMASISVYNALAGASQTYYIPYKNKLEEATYAWIADDDSQLHLIVGDPSVPVYDIKEDGSDASGTPLATGGGSYRVALQQARFQLDAGREDRWICQMQFVAAARRDTIPRVF